MKRNFYAVAVALFFLVFTPISVHAVVAPQIKTVSVSAYIPGAGGEVEELKLYGQPAKTGACPPGTLYFRNDTNTLEVCQGSDYQPISNIWDRDDANSRVFLANPGDNVGLNTGVPVTKLHINQGSFLLERSSGKAVIDYSAGTGPLFYYYPDKMIFRNVQKVLRGGTFDNTFWGDFSWASGFDVIADGDSSFIGNGVWNTASGDVSGVASGSYNSVGSSGLNAAIAGGFQNSVNNQYGFVGGGHTNAVQADYGAINGGSLNNVQDQYGAVAGGLDNDITAGGIHGAIAGGTSNDVSGNAAFIGAGNSNLASATNAAIVGGSNNLASGIGSVVSGGADNNASGLNSVVGGGDNNSASGDNSFVVGQNSGASGDFSAAIGKDLVVSGNNSVALGTGPATVTSDNKVVISGSDVGIRTVDPKASLDVVGAIKFGPSGKQLYATGAPGYRYQLQAHVNAGGAIVSGDSAFIVVTPLSPGHYRIDYTEAFNATTGPPIAVATLVGSVPGYSIMVDNMTLTSVEVRIYDPTLIPVNNDFTIRISGYPDNAVPIATPI